MKRLAILAVLVALSAGLSTPTKAQGTTTKGDSHADKLARQQQTALYKYQKKQEKAQAKAQRKADKQQQKASKQYEKEQRKQLKNANRPEKHTSTQ
jgi:hypothetical protein